MSGGWPQVDIVVTNHGYASFLGRAIESALSQTRSCRVIVVDDGSSDGSRDVIAGFTARVVAVFKDNGGQASAVNAGLKRCSGDVVIFLDSDDVLDAELAERVAAKFAADPALARVHYPMAVIDGGDALTGEIRPPAHLSLPTGDQARATLHCPFDAPWAAMSGNAFSAAVLRRILPVPEEGRVGADWYLVHVSSLYGPLGALTEPHALYRVHGRNAYGARPDDLDLPQIRSTIAFAERTRGHIDEHARALGLSRNPRAPASMSDVGNRMISLRLEPGAHPLRADSRLRLLGLATRACRLRDDVRWPLKAAFLGWATLMAILPRRLAHPLGAAFVLPARRRGLNALLGRLAVRRS